MRVLFFCPRWGSEALSWPDFLEKVKAAGYDGVEWAIPNNTTSEEIDAVQQMAAKSHLLLIAQHYETNDSDFNRHFQAYGSWIEKVKAFPWEKINSQTGKDYFSYAQNTALIKLAGKGVVHETHRGKFSFSAHGTKYYLETIADLRLTLDASHWVNVAESFLEDQQAILELAISRADHIHARVGYPEGPQVPDPRAVEWQAAVGIHLAWWDKVLALKRAEPDSVLTITPEFGPYPYMVEHPHSRKPVSNQWDINVYMMNLLKKRYV